MTPYAMDVDMSLNIRDAPVCARFDAAIRRCLPLFIDAITMMLPCRHTPADAAIAALFSDAAIY